MNKLKQYIDSLSLADQTAYAIRAGTTIGYLRKACNIRPWPRFDFALCQRLDRESGGKVSRYELRPDVQREDAA